MTGSGPEFVLPDGVVFRAATEDDTAEMVSMVNAAFEEENFFVNRPRTYAAQIAEYFCHGDFLLAFQQGQLVASVYYEASGERGYIGMLAVRPNHQGRGVGRAIMQQAEQLLRRLGCRVAELSVVDVRTNLLAIYGKLGYRQSGVEAPHEELRQKLTMPVQLIKMEKQL